MESNVILQGDALSLARTMPDQSVNLICTSPPYFGLRSYQGDQDVEWPEVRFRLNEWSPEIVYPGCDPDCAHEWVDKSYRPTGHADNGETSSGLEGGKKTQSQTQRGVIRQAWCARCGGWRGALGMEPDPVMFIGHLVIIFRELRRALHDTGILWAVIGDSYNGSGGYGGDNTPTALKGSKQTTNVGSHKKIASRVNGLKPKDLMGIPWLFAMAMRADGWYLRSAITWCKGNAMPESVVDRPTGATEMIFLLTKSQGYSYDADAIREPYSANSLSRYKYEFGHGEAARTAKSPATGDGNGFSADQNPKGRNRRNWWVVNTQAYKAAHFAVFPEKLVEIMVKAGSSEKGVCPKCNAPWRRAVERKANYEKRQGRGQPNGVIDQVDSSGWKPATITDAGWRPTCAHESEPVPSVVLDPFMGSGTVALVAAKLGRRYIGFEISEEYIKLAHERLQAISKEPRRKVGKGKSEYETLPLFMETK